MFFSMYMFACDMALFVGVCALFKASMLHFNVESIKNGALPKAMLKAAALFVLPPALMAVPAIFILVDFYYLTHGGLEPGMGDIPVCLALLGALLTLCLSLLRIQQMQRAANAASFWQIGGLVATVLAALVVLVATVSQLMFVTLSVTARVDLNSDVFRVQVKDVPVACEGHLMLVHWHPGATRADYRCSTSKDRLVMGGFDLHPFLPWPDYASGSSEQLAQVIKDLVKNAKPPPAQNTDADER